MTIVADDEVLHGLPRIGVVHGFDTIVAGAEPAEVADALDIELASTRRSPTTTTTPTRCGASASVRGTRSGH